MSRKIYPVVLTPEKDGTIFVEVPDMEILTQGKDFGDAVEVARDAIGIKGISMKDAGEEIPEPSPITVICLKTLASMNENSIVDVVDIDFDEYRESSRLKAEKPEIVWDGYDPDEEPVAYAWRCPRCRKNYDIEFDEYNCFPNCGQKIDRSEIEKLWGTKQ